MEQSHLKQWTIAFVVTVVAVAIAYQFLDRPIAYYSYAHFAKKPWFHALTLISEYLGPLAIVVFVVSGPYALMGRALVPPLAVGLLSSVSLVVATTIKEALKYGFGRTWPETWVQNNPSLIRDGDAGFGFNLFHGGPGYASFPSGHTTAVCAVMAVLWICYPRFRALYVVPIAAVVVGLLGADYHFLSDIIAGGFLGSLTGWVAVRLWNFGKLPCVSAEREQSVEIAPATDVPESARNAGLTLDNGRVRPDVSHRPGRPYL